jgi:hypothetical protein
MDMEQQDTPNGRTKRTNLKNSRFKKLDKHIQGNQKMERHGTEKEHEIRKTQKNVKK